MFKNLSKKRKIGILILVLILFILGVLAGNSIIQHKELAKIYDTFQNDLDEGEADFKVKRNTLPNQKILEKGDGDVVKGTLLTFTTDDPDEYSKEQGIEDTERYFIIEGDKGFILARLDTPNGGEKETKEHNKSNTNTIMKRIDSKNFGVDSRYRDYVTIEKDVYTLISRCSLMDGYKYLSFDSFRDDEELLYERVKYYLQFVLKKIGKDIEEGMIVQKHYPYIYIFYPYSMYFTKE